MKIKNVFKNLHRLIMRSPEGMDVHHRNENKLDNRRENLEVIKEEIHKQRHRIKNSKFGFVKRKSKKYTANKDSLSHNFNIGTFATEEEAALAYDWAARIFYGPGAQVNFPDVIVPAMAAYMIRHSGGKYFDVGFKKRSTGEFRFLTCRICSPPGPFYMAGHGLIIVQVKNLPGYKTIPVEGIETLYIDGKKFAVRK